MTRLTPAYNYNKTMINELASNILAQIYEEFPHIIRNLAASTHHWIDGDKSDLCPYHLEGDMLSHSLMVFQSAIHQLESSPNEVTQNFAEELLIAAIAHDFGKPFVRCPIEKDGKYKVRFYGHDYTSALVALPLIIKRIPEEKRRIRLLRTICLHTTFLRGMDISHFMGKYTNDFTLLASLVRADQVGRLAFESEKERLAELETVLLKDAWDAKPEIPIEQSDQVLTIFIGVPGCGKSYLAANKYSGKRFSTDETMLAIANEKFYINGDYGKAFNAMRNCKIDWVKKTQRAMIEYGKNTRNDISYDATNMTKKKRCKLVRTAHQQIRGIKIRYVLVWRSFDKCLESRNEDSGKYINDLVYTQMLSGFMYPSLNEGVEQILHEIVEV